MADSTIVTLLFTDLVGSSELFGRLGDEHAQAVLRQHLGILRAEVESHHGRVVKTMGDGARR